MRDRSWRRQQSERIQKKRVRDLISGFWSKFMEMAEPRHFGHLKKDHFGCGCFMCKPWKNSSKNIHRKHSDKKRLIDKDE